MGRRGHFDVPEMGHWMLAAQIAQRKTRGGEGEEGGGEPERERRGKESVERRASVEESAARDTKAQLAAEAFLSNRTLYPRYIGKCRGPTTPQGRYKADLKTREAGLHHEFLAVLEDVAPDSYALGKTYEFPLARFSEEADDYLRDDRERAIIAFFGRDHLLNRQHGGFYAAYTPGLSDRTLFQRLNLEFFKQFNLSSVPAISDMQKAIQQWQQRCVEYANENPIDTKTNLHPLKESYLEKVRHQATPHTISSHTILTTVGKDITMEEYVGAHTFLSGHSRAGHIMKEFLTRLEGWEKRADNWAALTRSCFPFVNLFPWMGHKDIASAIDLLSEYLRTVNR